jgi:adenylate cyclase
MMRWLQPVLALFVLGLLVALRIYDPPLLSDLRSLMFDQYQRLSPREYTPGIPVKIVDIDDESLARLGQWPWPRSQMAQLLEKLRAQGAIAVALDIIFAEPDRTAPANIATGWGLQADNPLVKQLQAEVKDPDQVLADEIAKGRVVVGLALTGQKTGFTVKRKAGVSKLGGSGVDPAKIVPQFAGVLPSLPLFQQAAAGSGSVNAVPDRDGIVRRVAMLLNGNGQLLPSLSAELLRVGLNEKGYIIKASGAGTYKQLWLVRGLRSGIGEFAIGKARIITDPTAQVWLRDTGHRAARYVPAWKVMDGTAGDLSNNLILIGTSAAGLKDLRSTPNETAIPGVEIHAQIIEQIITGDFLQRPLWADVWEIAGMIMLGIALIALMPWLRPIGCAVLGGVCVAAAVGFGWWAYKQWGWLLDPGYPASGALAVFLTGVLLSFQRSDVERRRVREAFRYYLAPAMVERVAANPGLLRLGGEMRDLTIMFCDIRDFTTIAEGMDATALTALLNDFLTPMTEAVLAHDGTIDKYIGDSIMAFWNAPLDEPDHARLACLTTLDMRRRLSLLNARLTERARLAGQVHRPIMIGIGLNSGQACVGNLGSREKFNYSAIGDNVNLASRIEGVSKNFGLDILIGEQTHAAAPDLAAIPIGDIFVKGKTVPARLYALIGGPEVTQSPHATALLGAIAAAANAFKEGNLAAVAAALEKAKPLGAGLNLEPLFEHMGNALAAASRRAG